MDYFAPEMELREVLGVSALGLAHIGDAVYETMVRTWLVTHGGSNVHNLHKQTVELVKATAQAQFVDILLPHLTEEEEAIYRRGRNTHLHGIPKSASAAQYGKATGLEALFGALWLLGRKDRLNELFALVMEENHGI